MNKLLSSIRGIFTALPWQVGFLSRSTANESSNRTISNRFIFSIDDSTSAVTGNRGTAAAGVPLHELYDQQWDRRDLLVALSLSRQRQTWWESKLNRGVGS